MCYLLLATCYLSPLTTSFLAVGTEQFGQRLDYSHDFLSSHCTYFDSSPEKLRGGHDIVLSSSNAELLELPYGLKRSTSHGKLAGKQTSLVLHRDLAAHIVARVVKRMETSARLAPFRILGGPLAVYLGQVVNSNQWGPWIHPMGSLDTSHGVLGSHEVLRYSPWAP